MSLHQKPNLFFNNGLKFAQYTTTFKLGNSDQKSIGAVCDLNNMFDTIHPFLLTQNNITAHRTSTFLKIHFLSFYRVYSIIICCSYTEVLFCGATTTFYCYCCYYYCYNYYNSSREFNFRVILISSQSRIKLSRTRAIHRRSKSKVLFRIQDMEL